MAQALDPILVDFAWQGATLLSRYMVVPPDVGDYVVLSQLTGHPRWGNVDSPTRWRVHAREWQLDWQAGIGECRPALTAHLRRLHPHEWGNRHEPTGSDYDDPRVQE